VPQQGRRPHDLVLVGTTKAYSGTGADITTESLQLREM
jgi:hypothetical protein